MEDKLLVFRCKQGSRDALRRIYEKYRDYLLILAVALSHDVSLGEDAVHDAFVRFTENLDKFELTGSLKAYLATCVTNRIRDLKRRKQNKTVSLEEDYSAALDTTEPSRTIVCNEELQQTFDRINDMAAKCGLWVTSNVCTPHCVLDPERYPRVGVGACDLNLENQMNIKKMNVEHRTLNIERRMKSKNLIFNICQLFKFLCF